MLCVRHSLRQEKESNKGPVVLLTARCALTDGGLCMTGLSHNSQKDFFFFFFVALRDVATNHKALINLGTDSQHVHESFKELRPWPNSEGGHTNAERGAHPHTAGLTRASEQFWEAASEEEQRGLQTQLMDFRRVSDF